MNWLLVILAWMLGARAHRDLTTWGDATTTTPPRPPRRPPTSTPPIETPPGPPRATPATIPAGTTTAAPWPQAVPTGLPPWPGGWEPDEPVGAGVAARAAALLPSLWAHGAGTRKTEQTEGRWVTYVATAMGTKRGVVAYRLRPGSGASSAVPASTSQMNPGSRTLRRGDEGTDVVYLQARLGVTADGKFGGATEAAVRTYQGTHGLSPDGVVGRQTWSSLLAVTA